MNRLQSVLSAGVITALSATSLGAFSVAQGVFDDSSGDDRNSASESQVVPPAPAAAPVSVDPNGVLVNGADTSQGVAVGNSGYDTAAYYDDDDDDDRYHGDDDRDRDDDDDDDDDHRRGHDDDDHDDDRRGHDDDDD